MNEFDKTDFLTSKSSFVIGMGSCLNIGGGYFDYNVSDTPLEADRKAIGMDWKMVGNDLRRVMVDPNATAVGDTRSGAFHS